MEIEVDVLSTISLSEDPSEVVRTRANMGFSTPGIVSSCEGETGEVSQPMAASTLRKVITVRNLWAVERPFISPTSSGSSDFSLPQPAATYQ
jgi:hypothetical protein